MTINEIAALASELTGAAVDAACAARAAAEIAAEYRPVVKRETAESDGSVPYDALSFRPIRVYAVYAGKAPAPFRARFDRIETAAGQVEVEYAYVPDFSGGDECPFDGRTTAYGAAAEHCLKNSLFEEAAAWDAKFRDSLARQAPVGGYARRRPWL